MIRLTNVSKWYLMGEVRVTALDGISLQVERGEFVVVLGPSGSGKTTLLNMIGALDAPSEGQIQINGANLSNGKRAEQFKFRREAIGFVFQSFNLFPSLTALENVQFVLDVVGKRNGGGPFDKAHDKLAEAALHSVDLADRVHHFPHQLSGGEQQRVAIARALAKDAPVILADEPTGELDFRTGVQILELLKKQAEAGKAVIVVTHNREIARVADRVVELHSGCIASDGPPAGGPVSIDELMW
jgi:putative ABC transport system ATP-binding protein